MGFLGQALMQAARPRSLIMPLQIGLGMELHHHFASKFLIDTLSKLGFCKSYSEVRLFEKNDTVTQAQFSEDAGGKFVQFIADSVDHNVVALFGKGTVRMMGIIATIIPGIFNYSIIVPGKKITDEEIKAMSSDMVKGNDKREAEFALWINVKIFDIPVVQDKYETLDMLWKCSRFIKFKSPMWSGTAQAFIKGKYSKQSSVLFLMMIDLPAFDMFYVDSTLSCVKKAEKYGVTPVCTFDQSLWWEALQIITCKDSDVSDIVIRLGGLHTIKSFLASTGPIMAESGLKQALEICYAENTVPHTLSGKAISKLLRAHQLVDLALNTVLLEEATADEHGDISSPDTEELANLYGNLVSNQRTADAICPHPILSDLADAIQSKRKMLEISRTAKLWLQYMHLNDLPKKIIRAERTGNWQPHLKTLESMLPYLAASGHNLYTKSVGFILKK